MLPEQPTSYPKFVADQLLTAENLNDLFGYLDMQERGTRINLIGIGIVCGLELTVDATGTEIVISKGCGVTSEGYLVRWNETRFANYKAYDAAKELVYPPFYASGAQRFPIDELKANASEEDIIPLNASFLADKAVLMFVELLRSENKNCDPESCDDKGGTINYTLRPLLIRKSDAAGLTGGLSAGTGFQQSWWQLPELRMPRHHIPAGDVYDSGDVFEGFLKAISPAFLKNLQAMLSGAWSKLRPILGDIHPVNPFTAIGSDFAFLSNGQLTSQQLLYTQYTYDLFSDLIAAYEELRQTGNRLLTLCCPDENLFPRHLLLGAAASTSTGVNPELRHGFIQSPALGRHGSMVQDVRLLFKRLVLMLQHFNPEAGTTFGKFSTFKAGVNLRIRKGEAPVRITPSRIGPEPLSAQAIPFYYDVASGTDKLFQHWNPERTMSGSTRSILSYHNALYNSGTGALQEALKPLSYDLENYNFLRIEGHVGKRYTDALAEINTMRDTNRLPFDVVALSADIRSLRDRLALIANSTNNGNLKGDVDAQMQLNCHFQDLEALYDTLAQGLLCQLTKELKYYYALPRQADQTTPDKVPALPLLFRMDPAFRYRSGSLGDRFEQLWKVVAKQAYITPEQFFGSSFSTAILATQNRVATNGFTPYLALMYYSERLSEILTTTLVSFNIVSFLRRYTDLIAVAKRIRDILDAEPNTNPNGAPDLDDYAVREDLVDHLDSLLYACKDAQFMALYNDYKVRWVYIAMLQKFGYYIKMHPGVQHKAGVPMGGTFVMVYHERSRLRRGNTNIFTRVTAASDAVKVAANTVSADRLEDFIKEQSTEKAVETDATGAPKLSSAKTNAKTDSTGQEITAESTASAAAADVPGATKVSAAVSSSIRQLNTNKLKATLSPRQLEIIDRLFYKDLITKHNLDELTAELPDQIVIADFYLPYMCCSDCPPIYYIINETKDEADPTIALQQTQFCNSDKTDYPITVNPAGGTISGEGTRSQDGSFIFNPTAVSISGEALNKIVAITYTAEGENASLNVTVFAKPKAAFDFLQSTAFNVISVRSTSTQAATFEWDFGDGATGSGANTFHTYEKEGVYTVTLSVTNGVCSDKTSQTITVSRASISLEGSEFCSADKQSYAVSVSPEGGKLSGEGVENRDGQLFFRPGIVSFGKEVAVRDVVLTYAVNAQSAQRTVKVFQTPSAEFSVTDSAAAGNIKVFRSAVSFQASHAWNFGDGGSSQEVNPSHQYLRPGNYIVTHTVTNGNCRDSSSQTVSMQNVSVSLSPDKFCSADRRSYPITVSPAGGQASGDGVSASGNGFEFRPLSVPFASGVASKIATIVYNLSGISTQTQVEVFQTPSALFTVLPGTASANERRFASQNGFKVDLSWDFGDGSSSVETNPVHTYKESGTYNVVMRATNGSCSAEHSEQLVVGQGTPTEKGCGPLEDILKAFEALEKSDPARYKILGDLFKPLNAVEEYVSKLNDLPGKPIEEQIKFFVDTKADSLLSAWFEALQPIVMNSDIRDIALKLWAVLADLAAYIMCIQSGDYDKNDVKMQGVFKALEGYYKAWSAGMANWSTAQRALANQIRAAIAVEIDRIGKHGESGVKAAYLKDLNSLLNLLETGLKSKG